jgi:hypothetical protein
VAAAAPLGPPHRSFPAGAWAPWPAPCPPVGQSGTRVGDQNPNRADKQPPCTHAHVVSRSGSPSRTSKTSKSHDSLVSFLYERMACLLVCCVWPGSNTERSGRIGAKGLEARRARELPRHSARYGSRLPVQASLAWGISCLLSLTVRHRSNSRQALYLAGRLAADEGRRRYNSELQHPHTRFSCLPRRINISDPLFRPSLSAGGGTPNICDPSFIKTGRCDPSLMPRGRVHSPTP